MLTQRLVAFAARRRRYNGSNPLVQRETPQGASRGGSQSTLHFWIADRPERTDAVVGGISALNGVLLKVQTPPILDRVVSVTAS
jgi:hypothetical protein